MIFIMFKDQESFNLHRVGFGLSNQSQTGLDNHMMDKVQNDMANEVKQEKRSNICQDRQEKLFMLQYDMSDTLKTDDISDDDTENGSDISSIFTGSTISSIMDDGPSISDSDSSALMIRARSIHCEIENIVDHIPCDMDRDRKRIFASHSMILRFVEIRRQRMIWVRSTRYDKDELNDLFR
jgi:hypothetical protein